MALTPTDFTRLYRRHAQPMLLYFQRRLHDAERATDLLAETFAVAIERAHQYRGGTDEALSAWLWAIARSQLSAAERHDTVERRHVQRLGMARRALDSAEVERIEELAGLEALGERIERHLGELTREQRDAVRLRVLEDRGYAELAARLGVSEQTARARVSRGLRELHARLGREPAAEPDWDGQ